MMASRFIPLAELPYGPQLGPYAVDPLDTVAEVYRFRRVRWRDRAIDALAYARRRAAYRNRPIVPKGCSFDLPFEAE